LHARRRRHHAEIIDHDGHVPRNLAQRGGSRPNALSNWQGSNRVVVPAGRSQIALMRYLQQIAGSWAGLLAEWLPEWRLLRRQRK
jgi:hypothetical protein